MKTVIGYDKDGKAIWRDHGPALARCAAGLTHAGRMAQNMAMASIVEKLKDSARSDRSNKNLIAHIRREQKEK